ncbi:MAG: hypothetical protein IK126_07070 [Bacteroidales bacterium]|nr:hypothetical protein [Bacteroidales bacterium]
MDKNSFAQMMNRPGRLTPEEWDELHRERDRYPFSAPLQVLALLADKAGGAPLWEKQALPYVSLYVPDVEWLYAQMEALDRPAAVPPAPRPAAQEEAVPTPQAEEERPLPPGFDILQEINAYQDVSFKTAPKSVILSNFLEKDGGITLDSDTYDAVSVQELAQNSIRPSDSVESETLAVILEKQGKLQQALAMYEKLMVNNPEKSSTFAVRIAELQSKLNG